MKRSWQEDPLYATEIEEAMKVAAEMSDLDDDWEHDDDNDDDDDDDYEQLDADYVKKHFDRLYVQKIIPWIEERKNVFVTGSPGRGKSTCMSKVIRELYGKGVRLMVTGSTGTAAVNIGHDALEELYYASEKELLPIDLGSVLAPTTVHSAFGLRKMENDLLGDLRQNGGTIETFMSSYVKRHQANHSRFLRAKRGLSCYGVPVIAYAEVVIVNEVSMMDGLLVETLDEVGRFWWPEKKHLPFGGLVMVFIGDFQQLPAVGSGTRQNPIYLF